MRTIISFIIISLLLSCSTAKQSVKSVPVFSQENLKALEMTGAISTDFPELKQTFDFKIQIGGHDSVAMTVYGPFSLVIGKLYSTKDHFVFYNVLTNEVYEGTPSPKNLKLAMNLPLSFNDFISVVRCETAEPYETFKPDESYDKENKLLFKSVRNEYIDFALFNKENMMISQYQRKLKDGKIVMTIANDNFELTDGFNLPIDVFMKFPLVNGSVSIKYRDKKINPDFDKPFRFSVPSSAKMNKFD